MFVSTAFAQEAAPAAAGPDAMLQFLPIILIFVVFYFLLIRPQQKKMKQHKEMLTALRRGDRVVTGGGIIGTVTKVVDDNEVQLEIAENVRVRVQRQMISAIIAKPTPAAANDVKSPKDGGDPPGGTGDATPPPPRQSRLTKILGGKSE